MISSIILLIAATTATNADVREPPYEPSGWKPSGAVFLLPSRGHVTADQLNNEQLPPLAPPPSTVNFTPNTNFLSSSNPFPDRSLKVAPNRQAVPHFRVPPPSTRDSYPLTTPPPISAGDHRPFVFKDRNNLGRTNPEHKDNQPFVHKLESVLSLVRPLQDSGRYDDPTLSHDQNQSQFPKQYLPSSYETTATLSGFLPQDNVAQVTSYSPKVSASDEFTYEAPPTDESSASGQQSVSSSDESKINAQRIFLVVLPARQAAPTELESKQASTQGFPFSNEERPQEKFSISQAPLIRSPRKLIL